jgi:hypothetical protein
MALGFLQPKCLTCNEREIPRVASRRPRTNRAPFPTRHPAVEQPPGRRAAAPRLPR